MKQKSSGNTSRREMVDQDQSFLHKFDCSSEIFCTTKSVSVKQICGQSLDSGIAAEIQYNS